MRSLRGLTCFFLCTFVFFCMSECVALNMTFFFYSGQKESRFVKNLMGHGHIFKETFRWKLYNSCTSHIRKFFIVFQTFSYGFIHRIFTRIEYFTEKIPKRKKTERDPYSSGLFTRMPFDPISFTVSPVQTHIFSAYTYFRTHIFLYTHYYIAVHKRWTFLSERPRCGPGAAADWWYSLAPLPVSFFSGGLTNENVGHHITPLFHPFCACINVWAPFCFSQDRIRICAIQ